MAESRQKLTTSLNYPLAASTRPQMTPAPEDIEDRIENQSQKRRSNNAPHHGRGDALHHFGTGTRAPHNGQKAEEDSRHRHHLGPDTLHGALLHRGDEIVETIHGP